MLGYFRAPAEVGIYAISWRLSLIVSIPLAAFGNIFSPMAAEYVGRDDNHSLQSLLQTVNRWVLAVSLPLAVILALFTAEILSIFGKEFRGGTFVLQLLVLGQLVNAASGPCGNVLTMKGWTWLNLINSLILATFNCILNLMMIPTHGLLGAALATAFSLGLVNIMRCVEVRIFLRISPYRIHCLKPLLFVTAAIIPSFILMDHSSVISLILFVTVYLLLIFAFDINVMKILKISKKGENECE
jgi:O-antigen/teichoic acid export membrane protein